MNIICPNVNLTSEYQIFEISNILREYYNDNSNIFDVSNMNDVRKISLGFYFSVFILKEIIDYICKKTPNGNLIQNFRILKKKITKELIIRNNCQRILNKIEINK